MSLKDKIIPYTKLAAWREKLRASGRVLAATNGCFDLLHAGHVSYLERARAFGDALIVGVNGDASVRSLKGPGRPINSEQDRAIVLAALESATAVAIFPDVRATAFLSRVAPDIYVKGGDYTLETLDQDERRTVESGGGRIELVSFVPDKSTTRTIRAIGGG